MVLAVLCVLAVAPAARASEARRGAPPGVVRTYVVRPGDTLWALAVRIAPPGTDPRAVADELQIVNHVDPGSLVPGQTLKLPSGL